MQTEIETITVLVADDHTVVREGVRRIFENSVDISIVGEAQDGKEVKELVAKLRPKVLLLDLKMPETSPVEIENWVRENYPGTVTLAFTAHHRVAYLVDMMDAGIAGYLDKNEPADDLITAIRRAARGELLFTAEQFDRARKWRHEAGEKWAKLTEREREILSLINQGHSNKTIAKELGITPKTVAYHISTILDRLNVESRSEAIAWLHKYFPNDLE